MTQLPPFVRIGGHRIPVLRKRLPKHFGYFEPNSLVITIDDQAPESLAWETLYHEVIEAINFLGEYNLPHQTIQQLGVWMHQAIESMNEPKT